MIYPLAFRIFIVWAAYTSSVAAKDFDCCEKIPFNRSHVNEFSIGNQSLAIVTPKLFSAISPFERRGDDLMMKNCMDFDHKDVYTDENGFNKEDIIHYRSQPCDTGLTNKYLIIGLTIAGSVAALLLVAVGVWWCVYRRRSYEPPRLNVDISPLRFSVDMEL